MNRTSLPAIVLASAVAAALATGAARAVEPGQPAPDIQAQGPALKDFKGKLVYLDFWASWCGPCRQSFPWMNEMQEKYGKQGLQILAVNVDAKRTDADKFLAEVPAKFAVAYDASGASPKAYQIKTMPTSILIGPDGTVQKVHRGFRSEDKAEAEAMIRAALGKLGK